MKILSDKIRKTFCYGSLLGAIALGGQTLLSALNPPQQVPTSVLAQVQQAMSNNEVARFNPVSKGYLSGLLIKSAATAILGLICIYTADEQTRTLEPDIAKPTPPQEKVSDEKYESIVEALRVEVATMVKEMPWLIPLLQTDIVMIVGEPGTGKSSIAQSLALLRLILFATGIDIVDPDLDNNLTRRTWVAGKAYGGRKDGPFPEQLESYFENLLDQEFPESQGHTAIFDEISKWTSSLRVNPKDAEGYIRHLYTTFRRKSIWSIMLLHGIQQDYNLPGCSAGTLTNIFPYAGIIKIEAAKDTLGKTKFSQVAKFKRPGQPMTDDNWEDILIRPSFHASKIVEMMGRGADYFGVGVETPGSLAQAQAMAQMVDILEEAIPTNQDLVARLEFLREQQIQAPHNLPEEELCVDTDLLNSSQCELVNRFYEFMTKKTTSVQPKDDGFYLVREIWRNWGYKQDSWKSVADFKDWLKLLEKANVGAIKANGQSWRWRFLKGFKGVK